MKFEPFGKIPRLSRAVVVTEKIDGTNASIVIEAEPALHPTEDNILSPNGMSETCGIFRVLHEGMMYQIRAASRSRFLEPRKSDDNFGFCRWVQDNKDDLLGLGEGTHYGEWWGQKIQRGYGLTEKRFSLFNTGKWVDQHSDYTSRVVDEPKTKLAPVCCHVVPILWTGSFDESVDTDGRIVNVYESQIAALKAGGSVAAPGFMNPEGIIIYHTAANSYFKKTVEKDWVHKNA